MNSAPPVSRGFQARAHKPASGEVAHLLPKSLVVLHLPPLLESAHESPHITYCSK